MNRNLFLLTAIIAVLLEGCSLAPTYKRPEAPVPAGRAMQGQAAPGALALRQELQTPAARAARHQSGPAAAAAATSQEPAVRAVTTVAAADLVSGQAAPGCRALWR